MLRWKRILVATDFSERAEVAVRTAERLAKIGEGTVWAIHVADLAPPYVEPLLDRIGPADPDEVWLRRARQEMADVLGEIRRTVPGTRGFVRTGSPWRRIVELAEEGAVDGICIGVSGHSKIDRVLLGSTAENVIRHSPVPVLVTRREPLGTVSRVLLPTELDAGSRAAIGYALERFGPRVRLEALHVVPIHPMLGPEAYGALPTREDYEGVLREFLDGLEGGGRVVARVVMFADPAAAIVEVSRERPPDLIVVSTHARKGLARAFFGSVSEKIVRHTDPPVLVLPGPRESGDRDEEERRDRRDRLEGEVTPPEPRRPRGGAPAKGVGEAEVRRRASLAHGPRGPWTDRVHTGRGGPAGRRGSGSRRGGPGS